MRTLIRGGIVVNSGSSFRADVLLEDQTILALGEGFTAERVIDATGRYLLPGGIDVHTHLDMPFGGTTSSDDFYTGHRAAACGGTTCHIDFCMQPNGASASEALAIWHAKADGKAVIDYGFHLAITDLNQKVLAELPDLPRQGVSSIKVFMAYKGQFQLSDGELFSLLQKARQAGILTLVHAENGDAVDILVQQAQARGQSAPRFHALTRPAELEAEATGRAIALAEVAEAPLYIVHLTCDGALSRVREARRRGARVWAETCIQYLFFTADDLARTGTVPGLEDFEGAKWVCSPPFRTVADQEALWSGLADHSLSAVSTDHCPFFFQEQKALGRQDFAAIPNGIPAIEDRLMILHHYGVASGRISLNRMVELTATAPAQLFGLKNKGVIAPGYHADIAIWDLEQPHQISAQTHHMRVDYNLFEGTTVTGVPVTVLRRGEILVNEGEFMGQAGSGAYQFREPMC